MWQKLSRSELLSTFFPTWIWQGRQWSKGRIPKYDPYFWINAHSHPVTSTYYPPSAIASALCGSGMLLDRAFGYLVALLGLHTILCFFWLFFLFQTYSGILVAIFGAITLTFSAYNWKQQPCFIYTISWFPWLLLGISSNNLLLSSSSLGMILLAGYYPIGLQIIAIAIGAAIVWRAHLWFVPIGFLIGLPQLIPFFKYLPKTIRTHKVSNIGKVPWWHPISLICPKLLRHNLSGVGYWEMAYYVGIVPLVLIASSTSRAWLLAVVSYFLMIGLLSKFLPRIPARWCFTFQFAIGWCAINGLNNLNLAKNVLISVILVQIYDVLWHNSDLIPTLPYSELYNKPSRAFNKPLTRFLEANLGDSKVSGLPYPLFTGHINRLRTLGYSGGMQLKLMAKWRHDANPDGSGVHDFFKGDGNIHDLERVCKYAYTTKRIPWKHTRIKNLYVNPSY